MHPKDVQDNDECKAKTFFIIIQLSSEFVSLQ